LPGGNINYPTTFQTKGLKIWLLFACSSISNEDFPVGNCFGCNRIRCIGVNILFRKDGKFPETEVGRNKKMKDLGITCPKCDEMYAWREMNKRRRKQINPSELKLDISSLK